MNGQCCTGGARPRRFARRLSRAMASALPGTVLALLPKCPLCLAAWLAAATGIGISAAAAKCAEELIVICCVAGSARAIYCLVRGKGGGSGAGSSYPRVPSFLIGPGPNPRWSRSTLFSLHEYSCRLSSAGPATQVRE
jgi:hypothetical protein